MSFRLFRTIFMILGFGVTLAGCPLGDSGSVGDAVESKDGVEISGFPTTEIPQSFLYRFMPTVKSVDENQSLTFSVENKPDWASFDSATGRLEGTPRAGDVGTYERISITASNGTSSDTLDPFDVMVTSRGDGVAVVSWTQPTENADGTPLTDLAGFKIYYGESPNSYTRVIDIPNSSLNSFAVEGLPPGIYYFVTTAYDTKGVESEYSNVASKTIG